MDLLRWGDMRIGRWLAYADHCLNAVSDLGRCQGYWHFVAILLGIVCVAAVAAAVGKALLDAKKGPGRYGRP